MTAALKPLPEVGIAEAARVLGRQGGRPRGSYSSPLAVWLRSEVKRRQREGYRCREAFEILRDSEEPSGKDSFMVKDWTADEHDLDIEANVTWANYRKLWNRMGQ